MSENVGPQQILLWEGGSLTSHNTCWHACWRLLTHKCFLWKTEDQQRMYAWGGLLEMLLVEGVLTWSLRKATCGRWKPASRERNPEILTVLLQRLSYRIIGMVLINCWYLCRHNLIDDYFWWQPCQCWSWSIELFDTTCPPSLTVFPSKCWWK